MRARVAGEHKKKGRGVDDAAHNNEDVRRVLIFNGSSFNNPFPGVGGLPQSRLRHEGVGGRAETSAEKRAQPRGERRGTPRTHRMEQSIGPDSANVPEKRTAPKATDEEGKGRADVCTCVCVFSSRLVGSPRPTRTKIFFFFWVQLWGVMGGEGERKSKRAQSERRRRCRGRGRACMRVCVCVGVGVGVCGGQGWPERGEVSRKNESRSSEVWGRARARGKGGSTRLPSLLGDATGSGQATHLEVPLLRVLPLRGGRQRASTRA